MRYNFNEMNIVKKLSAILLIAGIVLVLFVVRNNFSKEREDYTLHSMPEMSIRYQNTDMQEVKVPLYMGGCSWTLFDHVEELENMLYREKSDILKTVDISPETVVTLDILYDKIPTRTVVKMFSNDDIDDYSSGMVISYDEEYIICYPGYSYAVELSYGENKIMFPFRCI